MIFNLPTTTGFVSRRFFSVIVLVMALSTNGIGSHFTGRQYTQAAEQPLPQVSSRRYPTARVAQLPDDRAGQSSALPAGKLNQKVITTNLPAFGIPFNFTDQRDAYIEVQLYWSTDQGRSWKFHSRATPDQNEFPFKSDGDGEYWFAVKTLDRDRKLFPSGTPQPELKIRVDRNKPQLEFRADADLAGRVVCHWRAVDPNLQPESLKLFYQPIGNDGALKAWQQVPVNLQGKTIAGIYTDQIGWWPETTEAEVNIAIEIQDAAGNTTRADRRIRLPKTGWRNRSIATARPGNLPARQQSVQRPAYQGEARTKPQPDWAEPNWQPPKVLPANGGTTFQEQARQSQGPATQQTGFPRTASNSKLNVPLMLPDEVQVAPPVPPGYQPEPEVWGGMKTHPQDQQVWPSQETNPARQNLQSSSSTTRRVDPTITPLPPVKQRPPSTWVPSNPSTTQIQGNQVVSQSSTMAPANQYRGGRATVNPASMPRPELAPGLQSVPSKTSQPAESPNANPPNVFSQTGYKPNTSQESSRPTAGPISSRPNRPTKAQVTFIGTKRFRLPYGVDAIDPSGVGRVDLWITADDGRTWKNWGTDPDSKSPFPVELQQDGRYGFRVTIHSRDGLSSMGPANGADADIWVNIDTQAPLTMITSVPYGRGDEVGKLVINFRTNDNFLTLRPVTLFFAESPQGPWKTIEAGVRNEGRYVWDLSTDEIPDQIFLKIESRDRAGNVGSHVLQKPIDLTGLKPRATIHGVTPVGK